MENTDVCNVEKVPVPILSLTRSYDTIGAFSKESSENSSFDSMFSLPLDEQ
jgi:hypothetical protein